MVEPRAERPYMPGYGINKDTKDVLPWRWAVDVLNRARIPVLSTVRPDGRPHAMPLWGLWLGDVYCLSTAITSVKSNNLKVNDRCVVTAEDGDDAVIVEGRAELSELPDRVHRGVQAEIRPDDRRGTDLDRPSDGRLRFPGNRRLPQDSYAVGVLDLRNGLPTSWPSPPRVDDTRPEPRRLPRKQHQQRWTHLRLQSIVPDSIEPSFTNVKRERERNVTHLFAGQSAPPAQQ